MQTAVKEVSTRITVRNISSAKKSVKHSAIKMNIIALINANLIAVVDRINNVITDSVLTLSLTNG